LESFLSVTVKYFWLAPIVWNLVQILIDRQRGWKLFKDDEVEEIKKYNKLVWWYGLWKVMPWLVMGIGCTIGGVPTVLHYIRPHDGKLFVIAWWVYLYIMWLWSFIWVYFMGGAVKLAKAEIARYRCPGTSGRYKSPLMIKLNVGVFLITLIIVTIGIWRMDMPLPEW
jgi:hypothetical protein